MDKSAIAFESLRENDKIIGFRLVGSGQTEAESFCYSFPSALGEGRAEVHVEDRQILFKHSGYHPGNSENIFLFSDGGEFAAEVERADAVALKQLLDLKGPYAGQQLKCSMVHAWGKGFELRALAA